MKKCSIFMTASLNSYDYALALVSLILKRAVLFCSNMIQILPLVKSLTFKVLVNHLNENINL